MIHNKMKNKKNKVPLIQRSYNFEVRAEQDEKGKAIITGRPIVYDRKTDLGYFAEIIEKGALDETDLSDVRFLVNHDTSKIPLARSRAGSSISTMSLKLDEKGLAIQVELDTENNAEARALYSAVQRGDISGMSFMFGVSEEEWEELDTDYPTRHIKSISVVVEVSAVTFPAYEATEINARDKTALENARALVETERQKREKSVETDLELEKLKAEILFKER